MLCEHFPDGEQILDSYHCAAYVYETARAQYGEGTLEAQESTEATLTRLGLNREIYYFPYSKGSAKLTDTLIRVMFGRGGRRPR